MCFINYFVLCASHTLWHGLRECVSCVPLLMLFCGYVDNFQSCGLIQCHSVEYMLLMLKFALKDIINVSFKNFSCITKMHGFEEYWRDWRRWGTYIETKYYRHFKWFQFRRLYLECLHALNGTSCFLPGWLKYLKEANWRGKEIACVPISETLHLVQWPTSNKSASRGKGWWLSPSSPLSLLFNL